MATVTIEPEKRAPMTISFCLTVCDYNRFPHERRLPLRRLGRVYRGSVCKEKMILRDVTAPISPPGPLLPSGGQRRAYRNRLLPTRSNAEVGQARLRCAVPTRKSPRWARSALPTLIGFTASIYWRAAVVGRCVFRKLRTRLMVRA